MTEAEARAALHAFVSVGDIEPCIAEWPWQAAPVRLRLSGRWRGRGGCWFTGEGDRGFRSGPETKRAEGCPSALPALPPNPTLCGHYGPVSSYFCPGCSAPVGRSRSELLDLTTLYVSQPLVFNGYYPACHSASRRAHRCQTRYSPLVPCQDALDHTRCHTGLAGILRVRTDQGGKLLCRR